MIKPLLNVFCRQIYFTGVQSAGIILLLAGLAGGGFVVICQSILPVPISVLSELLSSLMTNILGVIFTLLVISARSVSAITTELATIRVTGEAKTLRRLGVDPTLYFLLPRLAATSLSAIVLYLYFVLTALLVAALLSNRSLSVEGILGFYANLSLTPVFVGLLRAGVIGALMILYVFFFSVRQARHLPDIPLAASNGVIHAIILMLVLESIYQAATILPSYWTGSLP